MKTTGLIIAFILFSQTNTFADVIFSDHTFDLADWSIQSADSGNGETVVASQQNDGPPQNEYRRITHTTTNGSSSFVQGRHLRQGWEYDPAISGGIDSISVEYRVKKPATDPYIFGFGFLLEQDGNLFYDANHYQGLLPGQTTWTTIGYTSALSDFNALGGTGATLDFSDNAPAIHFGLFSANSFDPHFPTGYTSSYNIDDFSINVLSSVPEPGGSLIFVTLLIAGLRKRQRSGI